MGIEDNTRINITPWMKQAAISIVCSVASYAAAVYMPACIEYRPCNFGHASFLQIWFGIVSLSFLVAAICFAISSLCSYNEMSKR